VLLEQYRPYITMMNVRARASILMAEERYAEALDAIRSGLKSIKRFFRRFGQIEAYGRSNEVRVLKRFARDVKKKLPVDPMDLLQRKLDKAVKDERYELAAELRDEIETLKQRPRRCR
jgi:excinuclease UvrABC helicase subunit UvrB